MAHLTRLNRIMRYHFRVDGQPKHPYMTQDEAREAAIRYRKPHVYRCRFCTLWHIGGEVVAKGQEGRRRG